MLFVVKRFFAIAFFVLAGSGVMLRAVPGHAQSESPPETASENPYGSGLGLTIELTNSGFGLGGYYKQAVSPAFSLLGELNINAGKDESEATFSNAFGQRIIEGKANYLLMMPVHIGLQQRLFSESIEANFRPFLQLSAGPTLGYEYPYFEDQNDNGEYDLGDEPRYDALGGLFKGDFRFGVGALITLGAHFGWSQRTTRGVRIGYRLNYFPKGIQLLEPANSEPQYYFGTPTITILFGRIF